MVASTDDYFVHNSEVSGCTTSDHTLSRLENPRLGPEALKGLLEGLSRDHVTERKELVEDHVSLFPHWMTMMCEGFSIFLCGVGSKKQLLSRFQKQLLSDVDHLVVNGFFPSLTIKAILSTILEEIMEKETHPHGLTDQLQLISSHYEARGCDAPLFLVVHNLDGPMLRNAKAQAVLSQLASFQNVHMIASLDHINAPLIFDGNKCSSYNPLWWDVTTLSPYTEETSYENSLLVQQSGLLCFLLLFMFLNL
ncbi:UNVERIFIED_CONTAM: hypothetical protein GTU68_052049 [Idotea baltica]|nr:hypothetical protein [Idotea baltica]